MLDRNAGPLADQLGNALAVAMRDVALIAEQANRPA
jgi:hypothetical protein